MELEINIPTGHRYWLHLAIIGLIVGISVQFTKAWSEPLQNPQTQNVSASLNTSSAPQIMKGGMILNTGGAGIGLVVASGNVGIGMAGPTSKLTVEGVVDSKTGGLKFPDGSIQTNADTLTTCPCGTCWSKKNGSKFSTVDANYTFTFTNIELCTPVGYVVIGDTATAYNHNTN